jgi:hypothetical protein
MTSKPRLMKVLPMIFFIGLQLLILGCVLYFANRHYAGGLEFLDSHLFSRIDPPAVPWNMTWAVEPLWGEHYFGDLPHALAFTTFANPWNAPFAGQPLSLNMLSILGVFGSTYSLVFFLILNAIAILTLVRVWCKTEPLLIKTILIALCFPLNISSVYALDRGNLVLVAVCCTGIAIGRMQKNKQFDDLSALLLIFAISLKIYVVLIVLLLAVIYRNEKRFFVKVGVWLIGINSVLLFTYPGSPIANIKQMTRNFFQFNDPEYLSDVLPTSGSVLYLFDLFQSKLLASSVATMDLQFVIACVWMLVVGLICVLNAVPTWIKILVSMSTFQMAIPGAPYVMTWNIIGILLLSSRWKKVQDKDNKSLFEKILTILAWTAVFVGSVPHDARFWISSVLLTSLIGATLIYYGPLNLKRVKI